MLMCCVCELFRLRINSCKDLFQMTFSRPLSHSKTKVTYGETDVPFLNICPHCFICYLTIGWRRNKSSDYFFLQTLPSGSCGAWLFLSAKILIDLRTAYKPFWKHRPYVCCPRKFPGLANYLSTKKLNQAGMSVVMSVPRTLLPFQATLPQPFRVTTSNAGISFWSPWPRCIRTLASPERIFTPVLPMMASHHPSHSR